MLTEFPDILHSVIYIDYKCFTHQKKAKVTKITELERVLYKQKKSVFVQKDLEINLV